MFKSKFRKAILPLLAATMLIAVLIASTVTLAAPSYSLPTLATNVDYYQVTYPSGLTYSSGWSGSFTYMPNGMKQILFDDNYSKDFGLCIFTLPKGSRPPIGAQGGTVLKTITRTQVQQILNAYELDMVAKPYTAEILAVMKNEHKYIGAWTGDKLKQKFTSSSLITDMNTLTQTQKDYLEDTANLTLTPVDLAKYDPNRYFVMGQVFLVDGTATTTEDGRQTGDITINVTDPGAGGDFYIYMANGTTGTVTSGTSTVSGSPVTLSAGSNTITISGTGTCSLDITIGTAANWGDVNSWSAASGGACGASVPTNADNVYFNANSFTAGSQVLTVAATAYCKDMDWTGATNTPTLSIGIGLVLNTYGSVTFIGAEMTLTTPNYGYLKMFGGTLTTNGLVPTNAVVLIISTGTVTLADNISFYNLQLLSGELVTANHNITLLPADVIDGFQIVGTGAKTLTLGSSTINCGKWNYTGSNLTVTANTATINVTGTGAVVLGTANYNGASFNLNGTAHTVSGSPTGIDALATASGTTQTLTVTDGSNITATTWTLSGSAGHIHTIQGSGAAGYTFTKAGGGTVTADYVAVNYSTASPTSTFYYGANSTISNTVYWSLTGYRYWVGGSGNTSDAATHWSDGSGGTPGAGFAPTSAYGVFFDNLSDSGAGFTVTVNATLSCASWKSDTVDQVMTLAGTSALNIYGSVTFKADHVRTYTGAITFASTGSGNTIDLNGITLASTINFNGAGGSWTLTDGFTTTGTWTFTNGTVNTNGQAVSSSNVLGATGTNALILGATTWTCTGSWTATLIDAITANTSTIIMTTAAAQFTGAGRTYYTVSFPGSGNAAVLDSSTYTNFTRTATTDSDSIRFSADQTVTGTFTMNGINDANRLEVRSNTTTLRTITAATVVTQYTSWYYVDGAGAADWDLSDDTGGACAMGYSVVPSITFTDTIYWVGGAANLSGANWSRTTGGTTNADWGSALTNVIAGGLVDLIFDVNSTAGDVAVAGQYYFHDLDASALAADKSLAATANSAVYDISGDFITNAFMILETSSTYTQSLDFKGTGTHYLNSGGNNWTGRIRVGSAGSGSPTLVLASNYSNVNQFASWTLNNMSLDTAGYDMIIGNASGGIFSISGTGTLTLGDSDIWIGVGFTYGGAGLDAGTSYITCKSFSGGGNVFYDVEVQAIATSYAYGANTYHDLTITGTNVAGLQCAFDNDFLVTNDLTFTGYNAGSRRLHILSSAPGTQRIIYVNGSQSVTWSDIQDVQAGGTTKPWDCSAGLNADMGNNLYITFTTPINVYYVGNAGTWSDPLKWSLTSGGAGGTARVPLISDTAIFDANSITLPLQTITMDMTNVCGITATAIANNPTFSGSTIDVYGSLALGDLTLSVTNVYFKGASNTTLSSLNTLTPDIYISKSAATMANVQLQSNITVNNDIFLISGTLKFSVFTLTAKTFDTSDTTYDRALDMDTGTFILTYTGTKWNAASSKFVVADSPDSEIILDSDVATACTFAGGDKAYGNFTIMGAGAYTTTITGTNSFNIWTVDRSEAAKVISGTVTSTILGLEIPVSGTTTVTITNLDFTMVTGEVFGDYLVISGSAAAGGATFWANAGGHSTNNGGNTGWLWTQPTPPTIVTLDPSDVTFLGERLNGEITDPGEYSTFYCYFEYGPTLTYGFDTAPETILTAIGTFDHYLSPYKIYHYRAAVRVGLGNVYYGADKLISLSGAVGQAVADITDPGVDSGTPLVDSAPAQPGQMYTEGNTSGIPVAPLIDPALGEADIPVELFWYPIAFALAIALGIGAFGLTKTLIAQAIVSGAVMAAFCGGGVLGDGLLPYLTVLVFAIEAVLIFLIQEKQHV